MNNTEELMMAGDIYHLLRLMSLIHQRYGGVKTRNALEQVTFMDAIKAVPSEEAEWTEAFINYRAAWNRWAPQVTRFQCHELGTGPNDWVGMPYLKAVTDEGPDFTSRGIYTRYQYLTQNPT